MNEHLVKHPTATFFVRVSGTSMINAGIHPGDILIVDRSLEPRNNAVVIAMIEGEFTVKQIQKTGSTIKLLPANPKFKPTIITPGTEFEVWGIVTHVIHRTTA